MQVAMTTFPGVSPAFGWLKLAAACERAGSSERADVHRAQAARCFRALAST